MRLRRRPDGRIVTKDCGRVRLAIERRVRWMRSLAASMLALLGFTGCDRSDRGAPPVEPARGTVADPAPRPLVGEICVPGVEPTMGNVAPPTARDPAPEMGDVAAPKPARPAAR